MLSLQVSPLTLLRTQGSQHNFTPATAKPNLPTSAAAAAAAAGAAVDVTKQHIGKRFKDVLDHLQARLDASQTPAAIFEATGHDVRKDIELRKRLETNERVRIDGGVGGYRYKPQHDIEDCATLLNFIRDHPRGTFVEEVKDSYKGVQDDLAALQRDKRIYVINHPDQSQVRRRGSLGAFTSCSSVGRDRLV